MHQPYLSIVSACEDDQRGSRRHGDAEASKTRAVGGAEAEVIKLKKSLPWNPATMPWCKLRKRGFLNESMT